MLCLIGSSIACRLCHHLLCFSINVPYFHGSPPRCNITQTKRDVLPISRDWPTDPWGGSLAEQKLWNCPFYLLPPCADLDLVHAIGCMRSLAAWTFLPSIGSSYTLSFGAQSCRSIFHGLLFRSGISLSLFCCLTLQEYLSGSRQKGDKFLPLGAWVSPLKCCFPLTVLCAAPASLPKRKSVPKYLGAAT